MPSAVSTLRQRNGVNATTKGSHPPPSSLAAHLAPMNGSTFTHIHPEDLNILLKESLGFDEDGRPNLGTDVILNHKLICMIIMAGLDTIDLRSDDPLRNSNDIHDQIRRCIEVICLAIERTPEALFVSSKSEDFGPRWENVPLFVWMIPRLLSLLILDKDDSKVIAGNVWPLLSKMLACAEQCLNGSEVCNLIWTFLEELTEGTAHRRL